MVVLVLVPIRNIVVRGGAAGLAVVSGRSVGVLVPVPDVPAGDVVLLPGDDVPDAGVREGPDASVPLQSAASIRTDVTRIRGVVASAPVVPLVPATPRRDDREREAFSGTMTPITSTRWPT